VIHARRAKAYGSFGNDERTIMTRIRLRADVIRKEDY
jgi:hypothetical protein